VVKSWGRPEDIDGSLKLAAWAMRHVCGVSKCQRRDRPTRANFFDAIVMVASPNASDAPSPPSADQVRELIRCYHRVIEDARHLPRFVGIPPRPRPGPVSRFPLPRNTFGTSTFVVHHISRSIDRLIKLYKVRLALGHTDRDNVVSEMLETFQKGLPITRWRVLLLSIGCVLSSATDPGIRRKSG
jgi:hypothetical protein